VNDQNVDDYKHVSNFDFCS